MNEREIIDGLMIRRAIGSPSAAEMNLMLSVGNAENDVDVHQAVQEILRQREKMEREGTLNSNLRLVARYILVMEGESSLLLADELLNKGNVRAFRFFFDMGFGITITLGKLISTEDELYRDWDEEQAKIDSMLESVGVSVSDRVNATLINKQFDKKRLEILKKDPTGFLVLDEIMNEFKPGGEDLPNSICEQYVLFGANIARNQYRAIYPEVANK